MLPERLLDVTVQGEVVVPRWLTTRDHGWVREVQDEVDACVGLPREEVTRRLDRLPEGMPWKARRALIAVLLGLHGWETAGTANPAALRQALFLLAARQPPGTDTAAACAQVAQAFRMDPRDVLPSLYADIPGARRLTRGESPLSTADLLERYNLALAQGLLLRTEALQVRAQGHLKAVLRFARLQGLICEVDAAAEGPEPATLRLSGPLSLFRFTTKYGRAMAAWLPALGRAPAWSLAARCILAGRTLRWSAGHRDPITTTHVPPRRFDSRVEERLARDLRRVAPHWTLLREADPVRVGNRILCPDFTLLDPARGLRAQVEVVGFWTDEYLRDKLAVLRGLPPGHAWIVCVDEALCDRLGELPPGPVLRYRNRIDPAALLALIEGGPTSIQEPRNTPFPSPPA